MLSQENTVDNVNVCNSKHDSVLYNILRNGYQSTDPGMLTAQSCVFGENRYLSDSRKKNANSVFYLCPFKSAYSLQAVKKRLIIKINVLLYYSGTSDQHVRLDK